MHRRSELKETLAGVVLALALGAGALPTAAQADPVAAVGARAGIDLAAAAAHAWAPDARLVYLENDEEIGPGGASTRWGYVYDSPASGTSRMYSVREGKLVVAENLDMKFDAPPLVAGWLDSDAVLAAADHQAGAAFRTEFGGHPGTMLLTRGAHGGDPDRATWTVIYTAPSAPSLFVVVDAADGTVRRTWRG